MTANLRSLVGYIDTGVRRLAQASDELSSGSRGDRRIKAMGVVIAANSGTILSNGWEGTSEDPCQPGVPALLSPVVRGGDNRRVRMAHPKEQDGLPGPMTTLLHWQPLA
ncbi:hypothetical protein [Pseudomonas sp. NBRC 100443]|uniref:hypothetical protein n=1 Tax=Pseudomonas sp. NBRC 100443 TaxID=1113665 RepID=UPI002556B3DB|nr:hypothetical protein [Pseudomonas sp. NBRC 100443]